MKFIYYEQHVEEFEILKNILKEEMTRIWGSLLDSRDESLDNQKTFIAYFEQYQHLITRESLNTEISKKGFALELNDENVASFIAKVRNYEFGVTCRKISNTKWIKAYEGLSGGNQRPTWLNVVSLSKVSTKDSGPNRFLLTVSDQHDKLYRISDFTIPSLLIENALDAALVALS